MTTSTRTKTARRATRRQLAAAFITAGLTVFSAAPANAGDNWSNLEVRGITLSMTYGEVLKHLEANWPDARIKTRQHKLKHANSEYEYGSYIEVKDNAKRGREIFRITFLPPENITDAPDSTKIKSLIRDQDIRATPAIRKDFIKQISGKYGTPTLTHRTKLQWLFDKNRGLISETSLAQMKKTKTLQCEQINDALKTYIRSSMGTGTPPPDYNKHLRDMSQQRKDCERDLSRIKNCFSYSDRQVCPYRMTIGWTERSETQGFVPGYAFNIHSVALEQIEKQRLTHLQDQLMKKALEETREKAKAGAKLKL